MGIDCHGYEVPACAAVYEEHVLDYGDRYKGMLIGDAKHGDGAYFFANGDAYEGEFQNDSMCGLGCYIFAGDGRYEGQVRKSSQ